MPWTTVGVALTGLVACVWDIRTRRVPNALTFGSAAFGLAFFVVTQGPRGAGWSAAGWLVGAAVFLPFFVLRGMGAGDVKLLAAFGTWLGPVMVLWAAAYGAIAGGVLAVAVALSHKYLRRAVSNVGYVLWYWKTVGPGPVPDFTLADAKGPRLPYAVAITVGAVIALWSR